jgi:hypothetical protein
MTDYLKRLVRMVPPPKKPQEAGTAAGFRRVEAKLEIKLPDDYKQLVHLYGCGQWQEFWYILNPFSENEFGNLLFQCRTRVKQRTTMLDAERVMREEYNTHSELYGKYPYPIYPEPGGIVPWAWTDNGGRFFWATSGPPAKWPTVYWAGRTMEYERFKMPCAELVFKAVSGQLPVFEGAFGSDHEYGRPDSFVGFEPKRRRSRT